MKTSLDLPDELYRRVKAKSAMEGRAVREVASALFSAWVDGRVSADHVEAAHEAAGNAEPNQAQLWIARWHELGVSVAQVSSGKGGLTRQLHRDRR